MKLKCFIRGDGGMYNISLENKLTALYKRNQSFTPFLLYLNDNTLSPVFFTAGDAARWLVSNNYSRYMPERKQRSFRSAVASRFSGFVKKRTPIKNTLTYQIFKNNDTRAYVIALDTAEEQKLFMDEEQFNWYRNFLDNLLSK